MFMKPTIITLATYIFLAMCSTAVSAAQPDSLLTERYITKIHITMPDSALTLLELAEQKKCLSDFRIERTRAMIYGSIGMSSLSLYHVSRAMKSSQVQENDSLLMDLYQLSTKAYLAQNNAIECIHNAAEGLIVARRIGDDRAEANFLLSMSESYYTLQQKEKADSCMRLSINKLNDTTDVRIMALQSYAYGTWMQILFDRKMYQQMLSIGKKREKLIDRMSRMKGAPDGYLDQQYAYLYSKMAVAYLETDQKKEAERIFSLFNNTDYASTRDGKIASLPYLLLTGMYSKAEKISSEGLSLFEGSDTISTAYRILLNNNTIAAEGIGDYRKAYHQSERIRIINDSLTERANAVYALELATIYQTHEKDAQILSQQNALHNRNRTITFLTIILLILSVTITLTIYYNFTIRRKNKILTENIKQYISNKDATRKRRNSEDISDSDDADTSELKRRFKQLDELMQKEHYYLKSDLSREDLMRMTNTSKNQISQVIQAGAGCKMNDYLNSLRLEHAVRIMMARPQYKIAAVAEESGLPNLSSFYRLFRNTYGITPANFRSELINSSRDTIWDTQKDSFI